MRCYMIYNKTFSQWYSAEGFRWNDNEEDGDVLFSFKDAFGIARWLSKHTKNDIISVVYLDLNRVGEEVVDWKEWENSTEWSYDEKNEVWHTNLIDDWEATVFESVMTSSGSWYSKRFKNGFPSSHHGPFHTADEAKEATQNVKN